MSRHPYRNSILYISALIVVIASSFGENYKGFQVIRITPKAENVGQLMQLLSISKLDVWREPRFPGGAADVMVGPDEAAVFQNVLNELGFNASVMVHDVDALIEKDIGDRTRADDQLNSTLFHWVGYHSLEKIHEWMRQKSQVYSNIASVISAGRSAEGREILGLRIAHKADLPIVFIEAGIHAREWVGPATATWFIRQVLTTNDDVLRSYEWHIFPSVNPDGYVFTRENRLWRKSRGPPKTTVPGLCYGVDLNRNWPFEWQQGDDECDDMYPGSGSGSEPETVALMNYVNSVAPRTRVYISLHNYRQLLMYPWAHTKNPAPNNEVFGSIAKKAVEALSARYGTPYTYGPIATTIYPAFGSTIDYAFSVNIPYPFVFELRDTGEFGFLLPKEQIIPTAQEALDALTVILKESKND